VKRKQHKLSDVANFVTYEISINSTLTFDAYIII